jgi:NDP-sugar pyrophosphorylase family protein
VGSKPILFILLDQLIQSGLHDIWVTLNHQGDMIEEAVRAEPRYQKSVRFIHEEKRLGTAGSLSKLEAIPTEPVLVLNADLLTKVDFKAMLHFHNIEANKATVAVKEEQYEIPYGVVQLEGTRVTDVEEKPKHVLFVNAGIYILDPLLIDMVPEDSYLDMPDLLKAAIAKGCEVGSFPVHEYWLDIGSHEELKRAEKEISDSSQT